MAESCRLQGGGEDDAVDRILAMKTIAVVGCSPNPARASHYVAQYMMEHGYRIVPVNPGHDEILGEPCYASLTEIPDPVDVVNVFRRSEEVLPIIEEAVRVKAKAIWLQDGVTHPEGEAMARAKGLVVVSNDCLMRRHATSRRRFQKP